MTEAGAAGANGVVPPRRPRAGPKPVLTMAGVVRELVPDGAEVLIGGFAYGDPVAFAHELIRQGRTGLSVMKTSGGVLVDMLLGAGCVDRLLVSHVWNSVGPVSAWRFRAAVENAEPNPVELEEVSYGAFTCALLAGACGWQFAPTTPLYGAGHYAHRSFRPDKLATVASPFGGPPVTVAKAIRPKLGVFHVHRCDRYGNAQVFGPSAEQRYAVGACDSVVLVAEEIVDTEVIRQRPELTLVPGFMVDAIVEQPFAAHPTDSFGYYHRDLDHHTLYGRMSRTRDGFEEYLDRYVRGTATHEEYLDLVGRDRIARLSRWEGAAPA